MRWLVYLQLKPSYSNTPLVQTSQYPSYHTLLFTKVFNIVMFTLWCGPSSTYQLHKSPYLSIIDAMLLRMWHLSDTDKRMWHLSDRDKRMWHLSDRDKRMWHLSDRDKRMWHLSDRDDRMSHLCCRDGGNVIGVKHKKMWHISNKDESVICQTEMRKYNTCHIEIEEKSQVSNIDVTNIKKQYVCNNDKWI